MSIIKSATNETSHTDPDASLLVAFKAGIKSLGIPDMCIALVDEQGELMLFFRMEEAPRRCIDISVAKAYTAIRLGCSTLAFHQRLIKDSLNINDFCDTKLTSLPGGEVIRDESGEIILGIGVSGGTQMQDISAIEHLANIIKIWRDKYKLGKY